MLKNTTIWLPAYIKQSAGRLLNPIRAPKPLHVIFCFVDHYEPDWDGADPGLRMDRVRKWIEEYPELADQHKDADGRCPRHTFFYPAECYTAAHLDALAELCAKGYGEVEIHLHHDHDTEETLKEKLLQAKDNFSRHGLLGKNKASGQVKFAFIHGNWSLNNSRSDGKWCGVNDESRLLSEAGCYADFTFPSAPSETQPKKINSIYYTNSCRERPKTHNTGIDVRAGGPREAGLMLIQGPLALNWKNRKGIFPRIENGDITGANPPTEDRVGLWVNQKICVKGKPGWIFVKVYTHGAPEKNADALLGGLMGRMFSCLETEYNDGKDYILHYVTAREMYNIVKAAEAGEAGNPGMYRDYEIAGAY